MYRVGREAGIARLGLHQGSRVLDVGCGTGLNFPRLRELVGAGGTVVGVDASPAMLRVATQRIEANGWTNVTVHQADAAELAAVLDGGESFDAVLFTYSLSIIASWRSAFAQARGRLRPGGRIAVVDLALPTGRWRVLSPLARAACFTGGVDVHRAPWRLVLDTMASVSHEVLRGGHIHVAAGTSGPAGGTGG